MRTGNRSVLMTRDRLIMNDTTRCYPRTLHDAFPDDRCQYAMACENTFGTKFSLPMESAVKYDYESAGHRCVAILSIVGIAGFVLLAVLGALA